MSDKNALNHIVKGSCHCSAVQFVINASLKGFRRCNCSICRRKGAIMAICRIEDFQLISGANTLSCYKWNSQQAEHFFCRICGIYTHQKRRTDPTSYAFNLGCIHDAEIPDGEDITYIDGASI